MNADSLPGTPALDVVFERMRAYRHREAVCDRVESWSYDRLLAETDRWVDRLTRGGVAAGDVCAVYGDFTPSTCALFWALMRLAAITVPLTDAVRKERTAFEALAGVRWQIDPGTGVTAHQPVHAGDNALIAAFRTRRSPGLIVFTSGSTGEPKGILHDCDRVLAKFVDERQPWRTLLFLMMDHFGGFNTFLSAFAYGGTAVCLDERLPAPACRIIEEARVELLPVTPSFLRLVHWSGAWQHSDLSSVRLITYGAEPMPQTTLDSVQAMFPAAKLKQTYGLSELGVLRSRSPQDGSLWLQLGGDGVETRIRDGVLWVRSASSMVGYLNAPNPFDEEGWMNTGDAVEERDGLIRFRGRASDIINVGGSKVFPGEVEDVLLTAANVVDATVVGVAHPMLGQVPCATVTLAQPESPVALAQRLRRHCLERLAKYKVPMRFYTSGNRQPMNARLKKNRTPGAEA